MKNKQKDRDRYSLPEFEDNGVGRLKKGIWEASDEEIDLILQKFEIPSSGELEKPGSYIQTTHPKELAERVKNNDVALIPLGATELHGPHTVSGQDIFQVTRLIEAVRRYTKKQGREVNLVWPPWIYGSHPTHHVGLIGTIPISQRSLEEQLVDVMFGLWSQGYRKMIFVNNHAQHWVIASAIDLFGHRYPQLPFFAMALDWCCAVAEFFRTKDRGGPFEDDFIHGDEAETSLLLLLAPEMVDMSRAINTKPKSYLPEGHFNKSANQRSSPNLWWSARGNVPREANITPQGVVGRAKLASAEKASRAVAGVLSYMTLLIDDILNRFPPGTTPPVDEVTLFAKREVGGYLLRPDQDGYKNPYQLWRPFS